MAILSTNSNHHSRKGTASPLLETNRPLRHGFQENGGKEEIQRGDLNRPRLGVGAVELTIDKHSEQRGDQQRSTTQRVANGESQLRACGRVAPVAESQKERRPNGYS